MPTLVFAINVYISDVVSSSILKDFIGQNGDPGNLGTASDVDSFLLALRCSVNSSLHLITYFKLDLGSFLTWNDALDIDCMFPLNADKNII